MRWLDGGGWASAAGRGHLPGGWCVVRGQGWREEGKESCKALCTLGPFSSAAQAPGSTFKKRFPEEETGLEELGESRGSGSPPLLGSTGLPGLQGWVPYGHEPTGATQVCQAAEETGTEALGGKGERPDHRPGGEEPRFEALSPSSWRQATADASTAFRDGWQAWAEPGMSWGSRYEK